MHAGSSIVHGWLAENYARKILKIFIKYILIYIYFRYKINLLIILKII